MSLLRPTQGHISIDGVPLGPHNERAWQAHIAHVAQDIFLSDGTIAENIAFGLPKDQIDRHKVHAAAKRAQISEFIEELPLKYETAVGERGVRLSGGQRQRIGIARALYRHADVIVFDEATSALDLGTERAVMESIESLDRQLTILIIAHRLSTLRNCNEIVELLPAGGMRKVHRQEIASRTA
jgi:ATP-binding cassette subfamily B protein